MPAKGSSAGSGNVQCGGGRGAGNGGGLKGGMTMESAARIQSAEARASGGQISSEGFAARAAAAAAHNTKP